MAEVIEAWRRFLAIRYERYRKATCCPRCNASRPDLQPIEKYGPCTHEFHKGGDNG